MGQPTRTHSRYSSLTGYRIVKGDSGDTFERIVVHREGLPVMPLTLYRYLRGAPGPDHTGDAYLNMLCPRVRLFRRARLGMGRASGAVGTYARGVHRPCVC